MAFSKNGRSAELSFGLAMRRGGPQGQTQAAKPPQGRASSEPQSIAPQGEAAAEAPKN